MNTFVQQGCIKPVRYDSKNISQNIADILNIFKITFLINTVLLIFIFSK